MDPLDINIKAVRLLFLLVKVKTRTLKPLSWLSTCPKCDVSHFVQLYCVVYQLERIIA